MDSIHSECGLRYAKRLHALPRINISVFGRHGSGKTTYVREVWARVLRGVSLPCLEMKALSDANAISRLSQDPVGGHPQLLVEREEDCEVFGASHFLAFEATATAPSARWPFLLNMLDYPGGEYFGAALFSPLRRSALLADAFMIFLDVNATQGEVDGIALAQIATNLRRLCQESDPRRVFERPTAICLSKIDLLDGSTAVADLVADMRSETDCDISLEAIEKRHRQWEALCPGLLDGLSAAALRAQFGQHVRVFPVSAVESENRGRPAGPLGLLEPILWVLHESGYLSLP